jgi:hypothetical protein
LSQRQLYDAIAQHSMTARLPFTQARIARAIKAADKVGWQRTFVIDEAREKNRDN